MKNWFWLITLFAVLLVGCEKPVETGNKVRTFEVVEWKTSKHTWVKLRDLETNQIEKHSTGKYCNGHKNHPIGSQVTLREITYKYESEGRYFTRMEVYQLCRV